MYFAGDPLAYYGRRIIEEHHTALVKRLSSSTPISMFSATPNVSNDSGLKVGILGAGVGGLYAALILDSLGIEYDIIEASQRTGGRMLTRHLSDKKYDYYEAGAMRFHLPKKKDNGQYKDGTMKRLAELIEYKPLNENVDDPLKAKLIPYYYTDKTETAFYYFNGVAEKVTENPKGSFKGNEMNVGIEYIRAGADKISDDVINPFVKMMIQDLKNGGSNGWDMLKENDTYSVRSYMASKYMPSSELDLPPKHLPSDVINWCALLVGFSEGYDRALAEAVLESLALAKVDDENDYGDVNWMCFDGGSQVLPNAMQKYIESKGVSIKFGCRVVGIREGTTPDAMPCIDVRVSGDNAPLQYAHVISTLPLPVLRCIDLTEAGLNTMQKNALRASDYGPCVKIAMLFRSNWWFTKLGIVGGQSFTDLPIRTIVHPSYGDETNPCRVLIASYALATDAFRLSALSDPTQREVLEELVLRNLAEAHGKANSSPGITYTFLKNELLKMDVQDWNHDPYTMGAFAFFSPGKFENLYTSLNFPAANKRLHFAGEALSTRHAWIVGALDSAWKAVFQYLKVTNPAKIPEFKEIWGENVEWTGSARGIPDAMWGLNVPVTELDLLDEHLILVGEAIDADVIAYDTPEN